MSGIRARRKAERPGEILEAAFEEFVLNGYAATRLDDVAARAGVTKGTVYFYFESKERVFEAAIQELTREPFAELMAGQAPWTDDLAADLRAFLERLHAFCSNDARARETLRLLIAEASRFPALVDLHFEQFMKPCLDRLTARLAAAAAAGEIRPLPEKETAEIVLGPMLAVNILRLLFEDRRPLHRERFFETHLAILLDGLRPDGPRARGPADDRDPGWSEWRPVPDPRRTDVLVAPFGTGAFDLRLSTGEPLLAGASRAVASRLTTLLPREIRPMQRSSTSRRRFLADHLDRLEYRTLACTGYAAAFEAVTALGDKAYRFRPELSRPQAEPPDPTPPEAAGTAGDVRAGRA